VKELEISKLYVSKQFDDQQLTKRNLKLKILIRQNYSFLVSI
jgi:hypothetical protein